MDDEKCICSDCVEDSYISNMIKTTGNDNHSCSYCNGDGITVSLEEIADRMHEVFENYYSSHIDDYFRGGSPAEDIIATELGVEEEVYNDIMEILCEEHNDYDYTIYGDDYLYERTVFEVGEYDYTWNKLKKSLRTKTRFFNNELREFLDKMFAGIEKMRLETGATIRQIDGGCIMYRARVFEDYGDIEAALSHPERNFGPPPSELATSGRMNAYGVPVFYGAASAETAIAEVRPAVGSLVVVAPFRPLRTLNLLDLSGLEHLISSNGSLFDPDFREQTEIISFLKTLSRKLTIPVFGKSKESEYLITQAVSEYLSLSENLNLDGIMFHSTQSENPEVKEEKDYNIVLFSKSSRVRNSQNNAMKYGVSLYENIEDDLWGISPSIYLQGVGSDETTTPARHSSRTVKSTLELDVASLEIHTIRAVRFKTDAEGVELRNEKPPFTRN
ncbi:RES family NAD+ phosphorylase [Pantoea anthophila]|uniref:RES domain-containing protein n=1 Tax=Pantoea anthophila TaxID=470931 RepID=A0ABY2Z4S3_9GAMM|nr:RES family NAD+ phosphorylase [Pantoea anthophila]TPV23647.1 RES domain-containing protein [Pantoea anthophila]